MLRQGFDACGREFVRVEMEWLVEAGEVTALRAAIQRIIVLLKQFADQRAPEAVAGLVFLVGQGLATVQFLQGIKA